MWRELPPTAGLPLRPSDWLPLPQRGSLEQMLAQFVGAPEVQIECSGTACLLIALEHLKTTSERTEVIISAYTCPLVLIAVATAGLQPVLCDTTPDGFAFDEQMLERLISNKTLAVIATHLSGFVAPLSRVLELCRRHGAYLIEDAAQALGASLEGSPVGTTGDIGFFSLSLGKGLTMYQGGFMVTRDPALRKCLRESSKRLVKSHPLTEAQRIVELAGYCLLYNPITLPLVYGQPLREWLRHGQPEMAVGDVFPLTVELSAVGNWRRQVCANSAQRWARFVADNRARGRKRAARLSRINGIKVWQEAPGTQGSWPFLSVIFESEEQCRQALAQLWTSGLGVTRLFIHALNDYEYLNPILPQYVHLPNARKLAGSLLSITNSHWLTDSQFQLICETLEKVTKHQHMAGIADIEATL